MTPVITHYFRTRKKKSKITCQALFIKGTQAWDNFDFFYLNQILICPSSIFEQKFASFSSIFARISMFEHFRGDWALGYNDFNNLVMQTLWWLHN